MRVITVTNRKGGCGKTTNAVHVAHWLALMGFRVLLVDLDSQGNDSDRLGLPRESGVFRLLVEGKAIQSVIRPTGRTGLDILPGNDTTKVAAFTLPALGRSKSELGERLAGLDYDFVVIDTPPDGYLQEAALVAADRVVVPTRLERDDVAGVVATLELIFTVRRDQRLAALDAGEVVIAPTAYDRRIGEHTYNLGALAGAVRDLAGVALAVVAEPVPYRARMAELPSLGMTIFERDAGSDAALSLGTVAAVVSGVQGEWHIAQGEGDVRGVRDGRD
ncbi:MAG: ParA family protein [Caldilineaceae bacterium]|nr:ParA family protein [Caldilineaceae bacterium]